ncbi:NAD(P)-dependent oxidoreductase [Salipaludibacillus daqingensis]|uniref:NAD(P)-dependent oxidoreductase n=1 Tax=Salipaludibacillus daqingensis TaxID=3041001 RepID=UPI0024744600|nr:SDR family oxidoreductase [Salipaludibacillus daqingensis]
MNIMVFGASGATGKLFVEQALEEGHEIIAFIRPTSDFPFVHKRLKKVIGDALVESDILNGMSSEVDAVVSCLGGQGLKPSTVTSQMMTNVLKGMDKHQVNRLIYLASAGVHKEIPGVTGFIAQRLLRNVLSDHRRSIEMIKTKKLDWTIVRPMGLTDKALTKKYRTSLGMVPKHGRSISRADVAHFMIQTLNNDKTVRQSIGLAT